MKLRVLVVDDEAMARKRLVRLLSALPDVEVVGECFDGKEVPARVEVGDVDLVLLDVAMTELSGLEAIGLLPKPGYPAGVNPADPTPRRSATLRALLAPGPLVVFVTAHAEHAVFAFDAGAVDYVLKPVEPERLMKALDRARERLAAREARADDPREGAETEKPDDKLAVPTKRGLIILAPDELRYALVDGESVILHTTRGVFVTDFRIVALERKLPGERFHRVHRRVLLNLDHVVALEPVGAGVYVAETTDGSSVPVSRQAARRLRARWSIE